MRGQAFTWCCWRGLAGLLHRLGAGEDIPIGAPLSGRLEAALDGVVGLFVNTVVLRVAVSGEAGLGALARAARPVCLAAYADQELPFDQLVAALAPPRQAGRHPLFQTMLTLHNQAPPALTLDGLETALLDTPPLPPKFDLDIAFTPAADGALEGHVLYDRTLFDAASAEALAGRYLRLLTEGAAAPDKPLEALDLRLPSDPAPGRPGTPALVGSWSDWGLEPPVGWLGGGEDGDLVSLLLAGGLAGGDGVALAGGVGGDVSHVVLQGRAHRLARLLAARGIGAEDVVALHLGARPDLLPEAVSGVLASGAAFLPLETGAPRARLAAALAAARPALVLTEAALAEALAGALPAGMPHLVLDDPAVQAALADLPDTAPAVTIHPDQAAYLLHTSGSTGAPKGVLVSHGAMRVMSARLWRCWGRRGGGCRSLRRRPSI